MGKVCESLRIIFISFEFVFILLIYLTLLLYPDLYSKFGSKFFGNNELWKYIPVLPFALVGGSIKYAWKIIVPLNNESNKMLYDWPDYWKLKLRVIFSIIICAVCCALAIIIWFFYKDIQPKFLGALYIVITLIPIIVLSNQLLAAFKIKELLEP
jgi:hypothetical protein